MFTFLLLFALPLVGCSDDEQDTSGSSVDSDEEEEYLDEEAIERNF